MASSIVASDSIFCLFFLSKTLVGSGVNPDIFSLFITPERLIIGSSRGRFLFEKPLHINASFRLKSHKHEEVLKRVVGPSLVAHRNKHHLVGAGMRSTRHT